MNLSVNSMNLVTPEKTVTSCPPKLAAERICTIRQAAQSVSSRYKDGTKDVTGPKLSQSASFSWELET